MHRPAILRHRVSGLRAPNAAPAWPRFLALLLATALALPAARAGAVAGRVLNAATGQYLKNARVEIAGTSRVAVTVDGGSFTIPDVPAGAVTLVVTYTGLDRLEQTVDVPETGTVRHDLALTSAAYEEDSILLGEFTVSARREGNARAIVEQKQAINLKTVIAADAFGDVTEGNVGEFLKLLPGVAVDYVDADVRAVRVRGLSPKYATVSLDGHPVANAASSSIATGRLFEFEQVSLATLDTIEVNKSPTADMAASGLTGSVNVRSKSALNQRGRQIKYNLNVNVNEYAASAGRTPGWNNREHTKWEPGGTIEFSDTFFEDRLGLVAAASHSGAYVEQKVLIPTYVFDRNATNNTAEFPVISNFNFQDGPKPTWRDSFVLNLDYKAGDDLSFALRTIYNAYDATFHNRNWALAANTTGMAFTADGTLNPASLTYLTNRTATGARSTAPTAGATASSATTLGSNFRKYGGTFSVSPSMSWRRDDLTFDGSLSYSQARNRYDSAAEGFFSLVSARMPGVSWEYEMRGETAVQVRQLNTGASNTRSFLDLASYTNNVSVNAEERSSKDQVWTANADLTWAIQGAPVPLTLKFGGDARLQVRDIENFNPSWSVNVNPAAGGLNLADYGDPYIPDFQKGESFTDIGGTTGPAPSIDKWALLEVFRGYNTDPFALGYATPQPFTANAAANLRNQLQSMWDVEENIRSAYAMATLDVTRRLQVMAGLRFESTGTEGRAFDDIGHENASAISGTTNTSDTGYILARYGNRITKTKRYDNLFPSVQARFEPNRQTVVRAAYFASILRPDFSNVAGGVSVSDSPPYAFTLSNADLEPETAHNFDLRVEYYFEPVGVVSAGVFFKAISDIQIQTSNFIDPNDIPDPIADLGFTADDLVGATVAQNINGGDSSIWGLEVDYSQQLSFLPDPFGGLGVFANATYNHPADMDLFSLTAEDGIPPYSANFGLSYRRKRFDCQVKMNWSEERVRAITGVRVDNDGNLSPITTANGANRTQYTASRTQVDLNVSYQFSRQATIFLNVANIFDETQVQFVEREAWLQRHGAYGARYTFGVKGSF